MDRKCRRTTLPEQEPPPLKASIQSLLSVSLSSIIILHSKKKTEKKNIITPPLFHVY